VLVCGVSLCRETPYTKCPRSAKAPAFVEPWAGLLFKGFKGFRDLGDFKDPPVIELVEITIEALVTPS
jgi:hypothetical protein